MSKHHRLPIDKRAAPWAHREAKPMQVLTDPVSRAVALAAEKSGPVDPPAHTFGGKWAPGTAADIAPVWPDDGDRTYDKLPGIGLGSAVKNVCTHDAARPAIVLADGRALYGAQGGKLNYSPVKHLDLIVDCAGLVTARTFVKSGGRRFAILKAMAGPEILRLDWPDMTAPTHVGIRFWKKLLDLLPQATAVCCVGGHGRTGTALAALLIAAGTAPAEAITIVRRDHCHKAIETAQQEAYLKGLV